MHPCPSCAPAGTTMARRQPASRTLPYTCSLAKMAVAPEMRMRDAISEAEKDSAIETATQPESTMPR